MRSLWIGSSITVLALSAVLAGGATTGSRSSSLSGLQQAIGSTSVVDLATAKSQCRVCFKDPSRCSRSCQSVSCPGGC
jgi:hypothetical protein